MHAKQRSPPNVQVFEPSIVVTSFSVHILVSRPQHARGGGGQHGLSFELACMSVQCVDRMNSVGSVIGCVSRNKVGPG